MDIFVINRAGLSNIPSRTLLKFKKREISNEDRLNQHCQAYYLLDRILRDNYRIEDREIAFDGTRPYLKSLKKYFSLSHSADYIALAFSDTPCGVDLEKNKKRDYVALAKRLKFDVKNEGAFYIAWTKYEAEYKMGMKSQSIKTYVLDGYYLTAVSSEIDENFFLTFLAN